MSAELAILLKRYKMKEPPKGIKGISQGATHKVVKARLRAGKRVVLYSPILGDTVTICDDPEPSEYSLGELYQLVLDADLEQLLAVHLLKRELGLRVC